MDNSYKTITRIRPSSIGKVLGAMYGILGFILGAIVAVLSMIGAAVEQDAATGTGAAMGGTFAILFLPLLYGGMGYVGGIITGFLYNFTAKKVGGIQFEVS